MREILFRAKRDYKNIWEYGCLLSNYAIARTSNISSCGGDGDGFVKIRGSWSKIIPETIGQYTGLKDRNGTKIFEGDIVKSQDIVHGEKIQIVGEVFEIVFCDGVFCTLRKSSINIEPLYLQASKLEVIGNIHDHDNEVKINEN